jgi:hypothetical protein
MGVPHNIETQGNTTPKNRMVKAGLKKILPDISSASEEIRRLLN